VKILSTLEMWFAHAVYAVNFVEDPVIHDRDDSILPSQETPDVSESEQGPIDTSGHLLSQTVEPPNSQLGVNFPIQLTRENQGIGTANPFVPSPVSSSPTSWQSTFHSSMPPSILEGEEEARLFRHYIENLSSWVKLLPLKIEKPK
jgi:hypothetical protein